MSKQWQEKYTQLTDYIARNPQLRLDNDVIAIPQPDRAEFYQLFNEVRSTFVTEEYPQLIEAARPLCQNFISAEKELIVNLSLTELMQPSQLRWYIDDPVDGLRRVLYDSLFDLLRGRITIEQFGTYGIRNIKILERKLRAQGYHFWVALALTNLLKPDRVFTVNVEVGTSSVNIAEKALDSLKPVREPQETYRISMVHIPAEIFSVPDYIVYSQKLKSYVAVRTEPGMATWTAKNPTDNYEWNTIDHDMMLTEGLVIVNISDNLKDLALIRDAGRIIKPDLALVCRDPDGWYEQEGFEEIPFTRDILNPRLGLQVISRSEVPREFIDRLAYQDELQRVSDEKHAASIAKIEITNIGFDAGALNKYVDMLSTVVKKSVN